MRAIRFSFLQMLSFVRRDMMLFAACFAPILAGMFFKFVIPIIEKKLKELFSLSTVLVPYYGLFDLFFSVLSPVMFCYVAAMVILEETDEHLSRYLFITPLGKNGYLIARLGVPAGIAFLVTVALLPVFKLSDLSLSTVLFLAAIESFQGIIIALLIITFSTNKLEGMAITKLSTLTMCGMVVPYFIKNKAQYALSLFPSFWVGKAIYEMQPIYILLSFIISFFWIIFLLRQYISKMS